MIARVLALTILLLAAGCDDGPGAPHVGEPVRPFSAKALTGETIELPAAAAGKVVVVRFWASWCAFCKDEMKAIEPIWRRHRDDGLLVLAVNAGQSRKDIEAFVAPMDLSYPILLDPGSKISRAWGVTALPMTVLVGRDGTVKRRILGETDEAAFRQAVEDLL
ncbi:TlpA disulfide reductase family protein [Magnetospirillum sp. UT-4]|uniref:TlpA family protein disulfide reductase n=1 Tax=Magnetospirillum sp. UT-4 TaxID=2681467 RepID=UPI00137D545A|nr:TlpA disulfide reductase family protein [Magnetospirillum sp. UT-4]CAA7622783.1 Thioredoxin [Magnetospirillum sp. UT-4]